MGIKGIGMILCEQGLGPESSLNNPGEIVKGWKGERGENNEP